MTRTFTACLLVGALASPLIHAEPLAAQATDTAAPAASARQLERDFWAAPSMYRLARYGSTLRTGPAYERMLAKLQSGDPAQVHGSPGFDAAKRKMKGGIVPRVEAELRRGPAIAAAAMPYGRLLRPKPIKPSLFKSHADVILAGEGDEDAFAAVAGSRIALVSSQKPIGWAGHQDGPQATGVTGLGDMGLAELSFTPGVVLYELGQDGLITAHRMTRRHGYGENDDSICGDRYAAARSLAAATGDGVTLERVSGYPRRAVRETNPLMTFALRGNATAPHKARIASRAARLTQIPQAEAQDAAAVVRAMQRHPAKVVLREIDLDADGVTDVLLWETPSWGVVSEDFVISSQWYVNVGGQWYAAGAWEAVDCT